VSYYRFRLTFVGRKIGSIGISCQHTVEADAPSESWARSAIRDRFEHVTGIVCTMVDPQPYDIENGDRRHRIIDTWNGGKGGSVIVFVSLKCGYAGFNECVRWVHEFKSYSFSQHRDQGLRVETFDTENGRP
jgi:hypothetical protein